MASNRYTYEVVMNTINCGECGTLFGMTESFESQRRRDHRVFYCPNGHPRHWPAENETEKLRRQVEGLKQREAMHEDDKRRLRVAKEMAEALAAKEQKARKRVETRIHAGVCPACNRTFANMARHMSTKHSGKKCEVVTLRAVTQ